MQYEIDTPLTDLVGYVGEKNAVKSYELCREAIYTIGTICKKLKPEFGFNFRPSTHYASFKTHYDKLLQEYKLRRQHGFNVEWMEKTDLKKTFGFEAPGGIFSEDGGEVDAYLLTHALLKDFVKSGHAVYNNTHIADIGHLKQGVSLHTHDGLKIAAKKLVIACGYESLQYVPKRIADIYSTYALVSEPLPGGYGWHRNSLLWETAKPYLYFRVADGNRILVGGRDDPYHRPRITPSHIKKKTEQLTQAFLKKMPHIPLKPDFSWAGAFAVTKDGLPYIGMIPERPHTYFALGFGGNGITFSVVAADIIRDMVMGKRNENAELFMFNR
ncbi:MAG: FAD-dependent oxidoreductase [Mucilaginibacter sp.]